MPATRIARAPGPRLKSVMVSIHRWVGLTLGVVFALIALSGTLLLFQPQFFRWAHGEMIPANLSPAPRSVDRWVENARAAAPDLDGPIAIWPPHFDHNVSDAGMLIFTGRAPGGLGNTGLTAIMVAPATGDVLGVIDVDRSPAYAPLFLHGQLWSADIGQFVIAIMTVGTLLSLSMGLYLWWPRRSQLLAKLSPKPWRGTLTHAGRLHHWAGAWTAIVLIVVAFTGLYMVEPEWVEPVLHALLGPKTPPAQHATACVPATFDGAIKSAEALFPGGTWKAIEPLDDSMRTWQITMTGQSQAQHEQTHVVADLACGVIGLSETPETRSPRSAAELWLRGIHEGSAFGTAGELFMALVGLVPLLLLWTGFRLWSGRVRMPRPRVSL